MSRAECQVIGVDKADVVSVGAEAAFDAISEGVGFRAGIDGSCQSKNSRRELHCMEREHQDLLQCCCRDCLKAP